MKKLNVALAGLGVVGQGVYEILTKDINLINKRSKHKIELKAVGSKSLKDFVDKEITFYPNILDLAQLKDIDVVIEVIGGDKVAYDLALATLRSGKKYVTANKSLLASKGFELAKIAEENNTHILYEAAIAGAIPIVKSLREGLAANEIEAFYGILNGTCNYILTKMLNENLAFTTVLKQAQDLGYAEADPTFDIKGTDTAHKLATLTAIATNCQVDFSKMYVEGIDKIDIDDIKFANELGYKIKLLAIYKNNGAESFVAVYPALIPSTEKIALIDDSYNAILTKASNANWNLHIGRGAGSKPTASAIVADIIDIANDRLPDYFGCSLNLVRNLEIVGPTQRFGKYFIKIELNSGVFNNEDSLSEILANRILVEKSLFKDNLVGVITGDISELELITMVNDFNPRLVKSVKFIRVEQTNSF